MSMVNIYCETINDEMMHIARMIADRQKDDVRIITPTEIVEVHHEKVSEGQDKENQEVQ